MISAIERGVRRALEKGNAADPDFRVKVYEAAERAMIRVVTDKNQDEAEANRQRDDLMAAIEAIEADYPPAAYRDSQGGEAIPADVAVATSGGGRSPFVAESPPGGLDAPVRQATAAGAARLAGERGIDTVPILSDPEQDRIARADDAWSPGGRRAPPARWAHRRLAISVIALVILLLVAVATWFALSRTSSDPTAVGSEQETTGRRVRVGSSDGVAAGASQENWIEVFAGGQIDRVSAETGGRVKAIDGAGGRAAVQIEGPADTEEAEIALLIGPGIVARLAGQKARGELTVGSPDDTPREFTIRCLFAGKTVCGRQRFSTTIGEETFVFDMDVPAGVDGPAQLAIGPGVGGNARDLNVYGFRLRPVE
ncbi:hypothetical protein VSX64_04205 [Aurantimonas sp. C2-6-R+9]|uniref:hypothetical protein n=1 Tax=unclassified Aurantimonas TaxID=2638230 RepID=UPI002E16F2A3|nr:MULTISPECIES: hypothetical protein [unclassified Aurantimonas]MEC5289275.1 hypothetical protein [Aurantimonas sp. C2-3-R2]MEC5380089.1 hypothetical protein [Aurantimonas sp. C2-6-R+9]MEC5410275.1 hypothetical protein [Aurantimonas sp. C2-4-R8]